MSISTRLIRRMVLTILGASALALLFVGCSDRPGGDQPTTGRAGAGGVAVADAGDVGTGGAGGLGGGGAGGPDNVDGGPVIVTPTIDAGTPAMLVAGPAKSIALDGTHVYWTDRTTNGIFKVAKSGGPTITLVPERTDAEGNLAVGPTQVCWVGAATPTSGADAILKLPIDGGTPTVVASQQYIPSGVAVDATNVYWTTYGNWFMGGPPKGTVMKASLDTGIVTMLVDNRTGAGAIAVDATAIYWSETGGGDTTGGRDGIAKMLLAGGSVVDLYNGYIDNDGDGNGIPYLTGIDGRSVYFWEGKGTGMRTIRKVPLSGGDATTVLQPIPSTGDIRVDGSHVYWVSGSAIMRVSVDGGTPEAIQTADQPSALAVDETRLYWTAADGAVMTLLKP